MLSFFSRSVIFLSQLQRWINLWYLAFRVHVDLLLQAFGILCMAGKAEYERYVLQWGSERIPPFSNYVTFIHFKKDNLWYLWYGKGHFLKLLFRWWGFFEANSKGLQWEFEWTKSEHIHWDFGFKWFTAAR